MVPGLTLPTLKLNLFSIYWLLFHEFCKICSHYSYWCHAHIDVMLENISFLFEDFDNFDYFKHLIMVY